MQGLPGRLQSRGPVVRWDGQIRGWDRPGRFREVAGMEEEVKYMTNDELVMSEQEKSNHGNTQNIQHFKEKDDVDKWLNAEITKRLSIQGVENTEDALISIIKSIKKEMKDDIMKNQIEASTANIDKETFSIASSEVDTGYDNTSPTASCLLPKELSPGSFLLPLNIDDHNIYAITTLEAKDNIMPLDVYKYLGLNKIRDAGTIENTTRTNEPLGAIDILVEFGTLKFLCNFIIKMADVVIILERPFLESTHAQIDMIDMAHEEETFNPLEIGIDLFSYKSPECLEFEQRSRSYGTPNPWDETAKPISFSPDRRGLVKRWHEEYAREIGGPYSRRFDEYNRAFKNEIEHLSNEYILRIGKKGYVLDDVWEKCQQKYKKINEAWHDEAYEDDEMWHIRDEKTDYNPPYVDIETFKVKKYSFKGGRSFICITDRENEALPLGRENGSRFKAMIRKELEGNKIQKLRGNSRDRLDSYSFGNLAEFAAVTP
ncbi:phospholipase-like protein [Tanacetum coccineum]